MNQTDNEGADSARPGDEGVPETAVEEPGSPDSEEGSIEIVPADTAEVEPAAAMNREERRRRRFKQGRRPHWDEPGRPHN